MEEVVRAARGLEVVRGWGKGLMDGGRGMVALWEIQGYFVLLCSNIILFAFPWSIL